MNAELEPITRILELPGNEMRKVAMMQAHWDAFDYIIRRFVTLEGLVAEADRLAQVHKTDFDTALAHQCAKLYRWGRDVVGIKVPFTPPLDPLCYLPDVPQEFIDQYRQGKTA